MSEMTIEVQPRDKTGTNPNRRLRAAGKIPAVVYGAGKDSLSMKTAWREGGLDKSVVAPVSLVISAFAPVRDVRRTLTPTLQLDERPTSLWLIDLSAGKNRLGGSALAQVYGELGEEPADLDVPVRLTQLAAAAKAPTWVACGNSPAGRSSPESPTWMRRAVSCARNWASRSRQYSRPSSSLRMTTPSS